MAKLLFAELQPDEGAVHELADGATIGRENCDVVLSDGEVSRKHATVRLSGGAAVIEDAGSRNGTFVNGERIEGPAQLSAGDTVEIGGVEWRYDGLTGAAEQTVIGAPPADKTVIVQKETPAPEPPAPQREPDAPQEPAAAPEPEKTVIGRKSPAVEEPEKTVIGRSPAPPEPAASPQRTAPEPVATAPGRDPAPAPAAPVAVHGDVPQPPDPGLSAVRPAIVPITDAAPNFGAPPARPGGASAARRTDVTKIALAILAIDAVLLILYFLEVFG